MKLSARNVLKGKIAAVVKGVTTAHVKIDVGHGIVTPLPSQSRPPRI